MKELDVAIKAAWKAGALIMTYYGKNFKVRHKGQINLVTEVDEKAQACIYKIINKEFPKDSVLGEEGNLSTTKPAKRRWIVDPLDGTTNFAHAYPKFGVSIAFERDGKLECGVIYDPVMKECFYARRNKGSFLNGKKIFVSKETKLDQSLLVTGFPYDLKNPKTNNLPLFEHFLFKAQAIRRDGSAALNLAYIACGRFDGFWELDLKAWDVAAGILLVKEAEGQIRNITNRKHQGLYSDLIAGNASLCRKMKMEIQKLAGKFNWNERRT